MNLKLMTAAKLLAGRCAPSKVVRFVDDRNIKALRTKDYYISPNNVKLTAVQLMLEPGMGLDDCLASLCDVVEKAAEDGSDLVCFPEYTGLLPLLTSPTLYDRCIQLLVDLQEDDAAALQEVQNLFASRLAEPLFEGYYNFFSLLASVTHMYIQAGSAIVRAHGQLYNRAYLFGPKGEVVLEQNKIHQTPTEKRLGICPGQEVSVADTRLGKVAILTGRDQQVFEAAKAAHLQGAQVLLCPAGLSLAEGEAWFSSGAFLRCQERPVFAVSSWFCGDLLGEGREKGLPFRGLAGVYGPCGATKMGNGIAIQAESTNCDACLTTRVDLERLGREVDLYTSDTNSLIQELLWEEYAHPRPQPESLPMDDPEEEEAPPAAAPEEPQETEI